MPFFLLHFPGSVFEYQLRPHPPGKPFLIISIRIILWIVHSTHSPTHISHQPVAWSCSRCKSYPASLHQHLPLCLAVALMKTMKRQNATADKLLHCAIYWTLSLPSFVILGKFPGLGLSICKVGMQCSTSLLELWSELSEVVHRKHLKIVCDTK